MTRLTEHAIALYQESLSKLAAEEKRHQRMAEETQVERFALGLKNVLGFPVNEKLDWPENVKTWPGTWRQERTETGRYPFKLRYEIDGLTFADTDNYGYCTVNYGYCTVLLVRKCPACGAEIMRPVNGLCRLGEELLHELDPLQECVDCRSRQSEPTNQLGGATYPPSYPDAGERLLQALAEWVAEREEQA